MQSPDPISAERQAIHSALLRVERRLRLNRLTRALALGAGIVLLALISWRVLAWIGASAPAATALVVLLAIIAGFGLLLLLAQGLMAGATNLARAAGVADRRGGLHDELTSALWFMDDEGHHRPRARAWIDAQRQRAARTAAALQAAQLVPVHVPRALLAGLCAGAVVLMLAWRAAPLTPSSEARASSHQGAAKSDAQVRALRDLIDALPQNEARRQLEAALRTLESGSASVGERRQAMAQAQQAVDQIKLDASASREGLQKLSQMLAAQPGMEEVAQALARGDAQQAVELLAKAQAQTTDKGGANTAVPPEGKDDNASEHTAPQLSAAMTEAQGARPDAEAPQALLDRLKEIARELKAANYVNEAWKEVKGPEQLGERNRIIAAGRFDERPPAADGDPSPGSSDKPMGGATQLRPPVASQGQGTQEQDGGTRMGSAIGDGKVDPLLGAGGERLEAQLKQHALQGQEESRQNPDQEWFYAESQKHALRTAWRAVDARRHFAEAEAAAVGGIAIQHRQVTRDYFVQRPEVAK